MTRPKRHHYLSKSYLEGFTNDENLLWVYDRDQNEYRKQSPLNTAVESEYYTVKDDTGAKDSSVEKFLALIDDKGVNAIRKINNGETLTYEEEQYLALFISFLHTRVPAFDESIKETNDQLIRKLSKIIFSNEDYVRRIMEKVKPDMEIDGPPVTPKDLIEFIHSDAYEIGIIPNRGLTIGMMIELSLDFAKIFLQMNWRFVQAHNDSSFVTTDNPFILIPPTKRSPQPFEGVGFATPGAQKVIPLSYKSLLVMGDKGNKRGILSISKMATRLFNLNVTNDCNRFVIGRDEELIRNIVTKTRIDRDPERRGIKIRFD